VINNKDAIKNESMLIITETIKSDAEMLRDYFGRMLGSAKVGRKV
jgi:hypothetical protein